MSDKFSTRSAMKSVNSVNWLMGAVLILLSFFFFWNIVTHFSTHLTSPNDGPLISWLIAQSAAFWKGGHSLYHWPIFYPYAFTATYSDPFLSLGLVQLLISFFVNNIVAQHNILLLISFFSTFFGMFLLGKTLFKNNFSAWIVAISFCFSFLYLQFSVHLHTFFLFGLPLSLVGLINYIKKPRFEYLLTAVAGFLIQAFNAPMTAYFIGVIASIYLVSEQITKKFLLDYKVLLVGIVVVALCIWYYFPSVLVAQQFNAVRTIRDTAHFSYSITRLGGLDIWLPLTAIILGSRYFKKQRRTSLKARTWILIAGFGAIAMLGPVIKFNQATLKIFNLPIPLPYAVIYYLIPGLQAFRAVTRWSILLNFGLSLGLGWLLSKRKVPIFLIAIYGVVWVAQMWYLFNRTISLYPVSSEVTAIYRVVKAQPETVLAEFPITQWDMTPFDGLENQRLITQLFHQKNLYNGVSGFMPPERSDEIVTHFQHFPDDTSILILKQNQVELVLVHLSEYQAMADLNFQYGEIKAPKLDDLRQAISNQPQLQLIECSDNQESCLYRLKP